MFDVFTRYDVLRSMFTLNGEPLRDVIMADIKQGWAVVLIRDIRLSSHLMPYVRITVDPFPNLPKITKLLTAKNTYSSRLRTTSLPFFRTHIVYGDIKLHNEYVYRYNRLRRLSERTGRFEAGHLCVVDDLHNKIDFQLQDGVKTLLDNICLSCVFDKSALKRMNLEERFYYVKPFLLDDGLFRLNFVDKLDDVCWNNKGRLRPLFLAARAVHTVRAIDTTQANTTRYSQPVGGFSRAKLHATRGSVSHLVVDWFHRPNAAVNIQPGYA